jgi:hypothetical protein
MTSTTRLFTSSMRTRMLPEASMRNTKSPRGMGMP